MQKSNLSEVSIISQVLHKRNLATAQKIFQTKNKRPDLAKTLLRDARERAQRNHTKVWQEFWKQVKAQADLGEIVDSQLFGTFAKHESSESYYFCPGPKSQMSLHENTENVREISQEILDAKLKPVNMGLVAENSSVRVEDV